MAIQPDVYSGEKQLKIRGEEQHRTGAGPGKKNNSGPGDESTRYIIS